MNNAALAAIRDIATRAMAYPFTLSFTREFTTGTLAGLTHDDSLGFCRAADADEWIAFAAGTPVHQHMRAIADRCGIRDWELMTFLEFATEIARVSPRQRAMAQIDARRRASEKADAS